jgi:polyhydroxyalkanoate synthesis regulator phasin
MAVKGKSNAVVEAADAEDVARKIWLAGVGAYGRMFAEATDRVGKAAGSANELFEQLVARGEALEESVKERLEANEATQKVAGVITKIQDFRAEQRKALQSRVETIRKAVDHTIAPFNPLALAKQVEELSERVAALEGKARRPAKPVAMKSAARRPAAKRVVRAKR